MDVTALDQVARRARVAGRGVLGAAASPLDRPDPMADIQRATRAHRRRHKCGAYAYGDANLPATLAAAVGAVRIVEVGTALGYTAASMAAAAPGASVDTIEMDADHVELARVQLERHRVDDRVTVHHGGADDVLPVLEAGAYDVAFFDGFTPSVDLLRLLHDRLRTGGLLLAGNMILRPGPEVVRYVSDPTVWQTHSLGETALCVRRD